MSKYIWAIIFLVTCALTLTGFALTKNKTSYAPNQENKVDSECKEFFYNKEATTRVVFFTDRNTTAKYANYLLNSSPYNLHKDKISIYYVDSYAPKCTSYKNLAVYCYSEEIEKAAEKCTGEYIVAFDTKPAEIRSSSYLNVVSINLNHPLNVVLHEFGHVFGKLEDEYVPAKLSKKNRNCLSNCEAFGDAKGGCFEGCSKGDYYRSIENGIMRSLKAKGYGEYDEKLISEELES